MPCKTGHTLCEASACIKAGLAGQASQPCCTIIIFASISLDPEGLSMMRLISQAQT